MDIIVEKIEELTDLMGIGQGAKQLLQNPFLKQAFDDSINNCTEKLADANKNERDEIACLLRGLFTARDYLYARIQHGKYAQYELSLLQKAKDTIKHLFQAV